ncbi:hypothetical protein [Paraburkholderia phenazinium]|uniref:Uncharacterized protein n=1 Tax=Paraburkholderia phenazinium TaxID=60549 RepID=A0A1N6KPT6_9BURK|nr:hypothetical protein [Paraburkholderia phenazinium]SIO58377.1 hypothetical protein SAMN05444165_4122 [Paraburkholderia phenazinium]
MAVTLPPEITQQPSGQPAPAEMKPKPKDVSQGVKKKTPAQQMYPNLTSQDAEKGS